MFVLYDLIYCENKCLGYVYIWRDLKFGIFWNYVIENFNVNNRDCLFWKEDMNEELIKMWKVVFHILCRLFIN